MERGRMAFTLRAIAEESRPFTNVRPDCRPKATRGRDLLLARKTQVILPRSTFILNGGRHSGMIPRHHPTWHKQ